MKLWLSLLIFLIELFILSIQIDLQLGIINALNCSKKGKYRELHTLCILGKYKIRYFGKHKLTFPKLIK